MGKKSQGARSYPVPMDYFVQKIRCINSAGLNVSLQSENPTPTGVWFRILHGFSMASYGEKITITLENLGNGTGVHILSECGMPTQIVDWGKNESNVRVLFQYLEQGMPVASQPMPVDPRAANAVPQPAPAYAQPASVQICANCGATHPIGDMFCSQCGNRLNG